VSADRERYWITVTMLDREVGGHPRWLKARNGGAEPMVISGSVGHASAQRANAIRGTL